MDFKLSQGRRYTFRPSDDLGHYKGMHDGALSQVQTIRSRVQGLHASMQRMLTDPGVSDGEMLGVSRELVQGYEDLIRAKEEHSVHARRLQDFHAHSVTNMYRQNAERMARRDEFGGYDASTQMRLQAERDFRDKALKDQVFSGLEEKYKKLFGFNNVRIDDRFLHPANGSDLTPGALVVYDFERTVLSYLQKSGTGLLACVLKYVPGSYECLIAYPGDFERGIAGMDVKRVDISLLYAFNEGKWPDLRNWEVGTGNTMVRYN